MIDTTLLVLAILLFSIASYTDLKQRIVKNKLTAVFGVLGLLLHFLASFQAGSFQPIFSSLLSGTIIFLLCFLLWKIGLWAAGDVKIFTALAVILPRPPELLNPVFHEVYTQIPIFSVSVMVNGFLLALPFMFLYVIWNARRDRLKGLARKTVFRTSFITLTVFGLTSVFERFSIPLFAVFFLLLAFSFLPKRFMLIPGFLATLTALMVWGSSFEALATGFIGTGFLIGFLQALSLKDEVFRERKKVEELQEGDIPAFTLVKTDEGVKRKTFPGFKKLVKSPKEIEEYLNPSNVIVSGRNAGGITQKEIKKLKNLEEVEKISISTSTPFVPVLFAGLLVSIFVGDLMTMVFQISPKIF